MNNRKSNNVVDDFVATVAIIVCTSFIVWLLTWAVTSESSTRTGFAAHCNLVGGRVVDTVCVDNNNKIIVTEEQFKEAGK